MKRSRWVAGLLAVLVAVVGCSSSSSNFDQLGALRGVDTILAAFKPASTGQGPVLLSCPFGDLNTIAATLAKPSNAKVGTLGKPVEEINPWSNASGDLGRAITCGAVSPTFGFAVGVQRGKQDEAPTTSAWKGPYKVGGGSLYTAASSTVCSNVWARKGTFFTVGIQILKPTLTAAQCKAAGVAGATLVVHALSKVEPFNVVPSSSGAPSSSAASN